MSDTATFAQARKQHLKVLKQYVPIVDRVHGPSHPEFHEVRKVFDAVVQKLDQARSKHPQLEEEFSLLRTITQNYHVPDDVCESYEAVYLMLSELDDAYHRNE